MLGKWWGRERDRRVGRGGERAEVAMLQEQGLTQQRLVGNRGCKAEQQGRVQSVPHSFRHKLSSFPALPPPPLQRSSLVQQQWLSMCSYLLCPSLLACRILVEDGTGEALVQCRNQQVAAALGLNSAEWEAVQSCVQSRGSISIQLGGTSAGTAVSGLSWQWPQSWV